MNINYRLLLITSLMTVSGFGYADTLLPSGFYLSPMLNYGHTSITDIHMTQIAVPGTTFTTNDSASTKNFGSTFALGYALKKYPLQFELAYNAYTNAHWNVGGNDNVFTDAIHAFVSPTSVSSIKMNSIMANAYYQLATSKLPFIPYVKVGVGQARVKTDMTFSDTTPVTVESQHTNHNFAWQAGVGSRFKMLKNIYLNVEYDHVDLGKAQWGSWYYPTDAGSYTFQSKRITRDQAGFGLSAYFG